MIKSYTKLPVTVEAIQWDGKNLKEVTSFISGKPVDLSEYAAVFAWERYENIISDKGLTINTLEGDMKASIGDYIIKGVNGEFYPCKPDIFNKTYHESNSPNAQEFEEVVSPIIKYLAQNFNPYTTVIITSNNAELVESKISFTTNKFID
jgi:hypothetical protein